MEARETYGGEREIWRRERDMERGKRMMWEIYMEGRDIEGGGYIERGYGDSIQ